MWILAYSHNGCVNKVHDSCYSHNGCVNKVRIPVIRTTVVFRMGYFELFSSYHRNPAPTLSTFYYTLSLNPNKKKEKKRKEKEKARKKKKPRRKKNRATRGGNRVDVYIYSIHFIHLFLYSFIDSFLSFFLSFP